jgi:hypothetical protein
MQFLQAEGYEGKGAEVRQQIDVVKSTLELWRLEYLHTSEWCGY